MYLRLAKIVSLGTLAVALLAGPANAVYLSTTGSIGVDVALSITKNSDINFGTVKAGTAATYTITTDSLLNKSGSGEAFYGTLTAGNLTITGSSMSTINISAGSYGSDNGVTLQDATCNYNNGGEGSCSLSGQTAPGAGGKTLLLGVSAVVDGTQVAGATAAPTFVVTVTYP